MATLPQGDLVTQLVQEPEIQDHLPHAEPLADKHSRRLDPRPGVVGRRPPGACDLGLAGAQLWYTSAEPEDRCDTHPSGLHRTHPSPNAQRW